MTPDRDACSLPSLLAYTFACACAGGFGAGLGLWWLAQRKKKWWQR